MSEKGTITVNDRVHYVNGKPFTELLDKIDELGGDIGRMTSNIVASVAANARKRSKNDYSVTMGGVYRDKWVQKKKGSFMAQGRGSVWNDSTGTWVSRTYRTGNGPFRLMNFNFETSAWKRSHTKQGLKALRTSHSASVSLTSQVANLWEFPATYKKDTQGLFRKNNEWGGWPKGTRKARPFFFSNVGPTVMRAIPEEAQKAKEKIIQGWYK